MGGQAWPLVGVLIGVTACSGSAASRDDSPGQNDGGNGTRSEAGASALFGGGTPLTRPGVALTGLGALDSDAGAATDAGDDAGMPPRIGGDAAWTNGVPGGMPQVISAGGPVIAAPVFQAVTFANYNLTTVVDDFVARVGSTTYWRQAVAEYGVGAGQALAPVHVPTGAPQNLDDSDIQAWLVSELSAGGGFAPPSLGTVYVLFFPFASSITFDQQQSCFTMGAYHNSIVVGGVNVSYAVVPECTTNTRSAQDSTTSAASHEMIEAVTDPLPLGSTPTYSTVDLAHAYYPLVLGGSEVGDLCAQWPASFFVPDDLPYMVQRTWSNAAVAAGRDPCQPTLEGETFFNAVPVLSDTVSVGDPALGMTALGASIAPGTSRIVDVHLYSEADVGPWTVSALNVPVGGSNLTFGWDRTTGNNGDTLHLTITANYPVADYGGEPFILRSTLAGETNYWLGFVGQ